MRDMLTALMIFAISRVQDNIHLLAIFHPGILLTGLAGLYAIANPSKVAMAQVFKTWPARVVAYLAVMACLSVPFGISIGGSGAFILKEYSRTLLYAYLLIAATRHVRDLYVFVYGYALACGFLAWMVIFVLRMEIAQGDDLARVASSGGYDSNDTGLVILIGLVFAVMFFQLTKGRQRMIMGILILAIGVTIARTGSRGTFLGLVAVVGVLLVLVKSVSPTVKAAFVVTVGAGVILAAPAGYWDQMLTILHPTEDYNVTSSSGRLEVWTRGVGYMLSNPVTGIGIDNFGRAEGTISDIAEAQAVDPSLAGIKWSNAHNSFVQTLAELGLPGFVLFCTLVFGGIYSMFKLRRTIPAFWETGDPEQRFLHAMSLYLPLALIAFAISGSLVSFAYLDPIYVLAAFVSGMYVSVEAKLKEGQGVPGGGPVTTVVLRRGERGGLARRDVVPLAPAAGAAGPRATASQ
jgi:O-antigen ligase